MTLLFWVKMMRINTIRLRILLGVLGIALPWIVLGLCLFYNHGFPDSISATYYLPTCVTPFMIILGSASFLLFAYQGYDRVDDLLCTLAGIFAIGICLFPCDTDDLIVRWQELLLQTHVGTFQLLPSVSGWIHNICAIAFFALLAYNSMFLFTKSSGEMTTNKRKRNIIFRVCGAIMAAAFVLIVPISVLDIWGGIWVIEAIALFAFGISWLTKADIFPFLFCDTPYKD